jgi:hypothetical protein
MTDRIAQDAARYTGLLSWAKSRVLEDDLVSHKDFLDRDGWVLEDLLAMALAGQYPEDIFPREMLYEWAGQHLEELKTRHYLIRRDEAERQGE